MAAGIAPPQRRSVGCSTPWLEVAEADLSPTTLRDYRSVIRVHLKPALGDRALRKLSARDLDLLYASMSRAGLAAATITKAHAIARRACNQAIAWEWLTRNPARHAKPPTIRRPDRLPPTVPQLVDIIRHAAAVDEDLAVLLRVAAGLGAAVSCAGSDGRTSTSTPARCGSTRTSSPLRAPCW